MSIFILTNAEVTEVRTQVGAYLTTDDITDAQIKAESILGAAADYVYERVLDSIDPSKVASLPSDEQAAVTRARDATAEDVTTFINTVLKPPQQAMFRRAIVYRTAGLCVPIVRKVTAETAGVVTQSIANEDAGTRQQSLFDACDRDIDLLRNAFPDDIFKSATEVVSLDIMRVI